MKLYGDIPGRLKIDQQQYVSELTPRGGLRDPLQLRLRERLRRRGGDRDRLRPGGDRERDRLQLRLRERGRRRLGGDRDRLRRESRPGLSSPGGGPPSG